MLEIHVLSYTSGNGFIEFPIIMIFSNEFK